MALNTLLSIIPWVILILISLAAIAIIVFLVFAEKVLKKKVVIKQQKEENSPQRRIKLLISTKEPTQNKLRKLNALAKEIFRNYRFDSKLSYYEMADRFTEKGKKDPARFCREMFTIFYSGEELDSKKIIDLANLLLKIEEKFREEKSLRNLERNMQTSMKEHPQINLLQKLKKTENKIIDKFARERKIEPLQEEIPAKEPVAQRPRPLPKTPQITYATKRDKLKNLPLIRLFRFGTKRQEVQPEIKKYSEKEIPEAPKPQPEIQTSKINIPKKEKSKYQTIEDLKNEILERQRQIEKLRTEQQIKKLETPKVEIEINKDKSWPPVTFTPKHLNETRKMSPEIEESFQKTNREIELLENEIKTKQHKLKNLEPKPMQESAEYHVKKPSPAIKRFLNKITRQDKNIDKEMSMKKKQIDLINIKREPNYPSYSAPKVVAPRKKTIKAEPKNKPLKKEEYIHNVDNMDRIKGRIYMRRARLQN